MNDIRFQYKPKAWIYLIAIVLFGGMAWFFINEAVTNDRGLIINNIITLSLSGATIFFWSLAVFSGAIAILGVAILIRGIGSHKEVVVTATHIEAPKNGISNKIISVRFDQIRDIQLQQVQKQKFLNIFHIDGKLTIVEGMLPTKEDFDRLAVIVSERVRKA